MVEERVDVDHPRRGLLITGVVVSAISAAALVVMVGFLNSYLFSALSMLVGAILLVGLVLLVLGLVRRSSGSTTQPTAGEIRTVRLDDGREILVVDRPGTNGFAVASFVLGLLGLNLLGLVFGLVALRQIRRSPGETGRGLAIAGIVLSIVWVLLFGALALTLTSAS